MHTRKRGRSRSHKDRQYDPAKFAFIDQQEVLGAAVRLSKEYTSLSQIGIMLRDQYGVPGVKYVFGKKLSDLLAENGYKSDFPEDLTNLIERYKNVSKHTKLNPKDHANIRKQELIMSKILRLVKYYRREGKIPQEWALDKVL